MAYTTTVLSWGLVDYEAGYTSAGTYGVVTVKVKTENVQFGRRDGASGCKRIAGL